jgi:eukaryotic-like serine/threonine-protein kinase
MQVGSYKVIKQIGEGAFGRTFYAEHVDLGEKAPVCLKQNKIDDPEFNKMFRDEALLLWNIPHPGLVSVKDFYEGPEFHQVMVMTYAEGANLQELVEKNGPVDYEHTCWVMQRLLDAISYLHYRGIVHCDIKPNNIIIRTAVHEAILVDFGLYVENPGADTVAKGGTEFFIPPEFALGLPPLPASDIYSLGKTILYMIGGNQNTSAFPKGVPDDFKRIVSSMIRRDSLKRPQDAKSLIGDVFRFRKSFYGRTAAPDEFNYQKGARS